MAINILFIHDGAAAHQQSSRRLLDNARRLCLDLKIAFLSYFGVSYLTLPLFLRRRRWSCG